MVRFCSGSLQAGGFFSVVYLTLYLWEDLLQRPLDGAGSVPWCQWCLDQIQLFFLFFLYMFQLWHFICDSHLAREVSECSSSGPSLVLPSQLRRITSGLLLSKPRHEFLYHYLFLIHMLLSPQILQPTAAAASAPKAPQLWCCPLQTKIKHLCITLAQSLGTGMFRRSSRLWYHDRESSLYL